MRRPRHSADATSVGACRATAWPQRVFRQAFSQSQVTVISKLLLGKGAKPEAGDAAGSLQNVLAVHLAAVRLRTRMVAKQSWASVAAKT